MAMPMTAPMAAKPSNKWLGPLAGLAAGAGLMALMSNMGIGAGVGEMLSSLLMYGALALLALFVYRRFLAKKPPVLNANTPYSNQSVSNNAYTAPNNTAYASNTAAVDNSYASNNHPAVPDITAFVNNAKSQYLALQVAWDAGDLSKLRTMTTDNLFMELAQQVANRKGAPNHTEIMNLHCELLDVRDEQNDTIATLRFTGTAREDNQPTSGLEDIWMLTKPASSSHGWLLAGVENK
jgi:predicted lipid-binding transport protein (Tim44 family)